LSKKTVGKGSFGVDAVLKVFYPREGRKFPVENSIRSFNPIR
jgi:hypothetical protein